MPRMACYSLASIRNSCGLKNRRVPIRGSEKSHGGLLGKPSDVRVERPEQKLSTARRTTAAPDGTAVFLWPGFLVRNRKDKHTMNQSPAASIRILADNPNHHLWNNHGTFWCHYTLHLPDYTKRRVRQSLGTSCIDRARRLRDQLLRRALKGGAL